MKKMLMAAAVAVTFGAWADTETVGGYTWTYQINGDTAEIRNGYSAAISPSPTGAVTIPSMLGGKLVTSIGSSAFSSCSGLMSVTIPDSVTNIGSSAFSSCSGLTSVTIPDSVTSIGYSAFYDCSGITSVTIPQVVCSSRLSSAFPSSYQSITNVVISSSVTSIVPGAFSGCSKLMGIEVLEGNANYSSVNGLLLSKDGNTLVQGVNRNVITIPDSVTSIGDWAFENCSGLTSIMLPNSVSTIGYEAFHDCTNLKIVRLPLAFTYDTTFTYDEYYSSYDSSPFAGCSSIETVEVPGCYGLDDLFPAAHGIKTVIVKDGETDMSANFGSYFVADYYDSNYGYSYSYYSYRTNLTAILIPHSVTNIGSSLAGCVGLREINLPPNLKGRVSFNGCSSLESIDIPEGVEGLDDYAFGNCTNLKRLSFPATLRKIGYNSSSMVFEGCRSIESITVAEGNPNFAVREGCLVNTKEALLIFAFSRYDLCGRVIIPEGITSLGYNAFDNCEGMTSLQIPNSLTTISSGLFNSCTNLGAFIVDVTHPAYSTIDGVLMSKDGSSIVAIPAKARRVTIPDGMTVNANTFYACSDLAEIVVSDTNPNYVFQGGLLLSRDGTSIVAVPKGATSITIPDFVTSIDSSFLAGCRSLAELTIPTNVAYISTDAFNDCPSLSRINLAAGSPIVFTDDYFANNLGVGINVTGSESKVLTTLEVVNVTDQYWTDPSTGEPRTLDFLSIWDGSDFVLCNGYDLYGSWQEWWNREDGWRLYEYLFGNRYYYYDASAIDSMSSIFNVKDENGNLLEYGRDWYLVRTSESYYSMSENDSWTHYNNVDYSIVGCGEYYGSFNFTARAECRHEQPWYSILFLSDGVEVARNNYYYSPGDVNNWWSITDDSYYETISGTYGGEPITDHFGNVVLGQYGVSNELQVVTYSGAPRIEAVYDCRRRDEYGNWRQCIENVDYVCVSSEPNTWSGSGEITTSVVFKNSGSYQIQLVFPEGTPYYPDYMPMWFEERWETVHVSIAPQAIGELPVCGNLSTVYTGEEIRPSDEWGLWTPECSRAYYDAAVVVTNVGNYQVGIGVEYNYDSGVYTHPNIDGDWVELMSWPWNEFMDSQDMPVNYMGLTNLTFTVLPRPVTIGQMSCSISNNTVFDGTVKVLSNIIITNDYNGAVLQDGVDYDVSYSDNVNPGLATATITCKGNYTGTFTKAFTIAPASFDLTGGGGSAGGYSGGTGRIVGYEGKYDGNGHGLNVDVTTLNDVRTKYALAEDGPYVDQLLFTNVCDQTVWFELSASNYNSFTGFARVVISPRSITNATVTAENVVSVAGGVPQLSYSVADAALGKTLVNGVDYTARVENDETEGVTTITLSGIGNYEGETRATTVFQRSIADFGFELSATEYFYDSTQKRPAVTVTDSVTQGVLEAGRDYTVAYYDNTGVGAARVVVTGIGVYTGSKTLTFNIIYRHFEQNGVAWQYWERNGQAKLVGFTPADGGAMPSVVVIPDEIDGLPVQEIPDGFLRGRSTVEVVVVGANVVSCGNYVFSGCGSLKYVIFTGDAPSVNQLWDSTEGVEEYMSVFTGAPAGVKVVAVKSDGGWGDSWPVGSESRLVVGCPHVTITPASGKKSGRMTVTITSDSEMSETEVRYTTDGSMPTAESPLYERRFTINVTGLVSVKAAVFLGGVRIGDVVETRYSPVLNDVLNIGDIIAKEGSAPLFFDLDSRNQWWSDESETSYDGTPSMKSGKIGNEETSWMSASFTGAGIFEFSWKASCEYDDLGEYFFDHAVCELDGVEVAWLDGVTDGWVREEIQVESAGEHIVRWIYVKDDADDATYPGEDCVWVDGVKFSYPVHVSFAAGAGTGEPPQPLMGAIGYDVTLPDQGGLAYARHRFDGWSDGERVYGAGTPYTVGTADVTLTAVWADKVLAAPVIGVAESYDEEAATVTIGAEAEATVYYTTDGSVPNAETGIRYDGAFQVVGTTTIKAIAVADDWFDSDVAEMTATRSWSSLEECLGAEGFVLATGGDANWIGDASEGCVKTAAHAGGWLTATFTGSGVATYLLREGTGEWVRRDEVFLDGGEHVLRWEGEAMAVKSLELLPVVTVSFAGFDDVVGEWPSSIHSAEGRNVSLPDGEGISRPRHAFSGWSDGAKLWSPSEGYCVGTTDVVLTAVWTAKTLQRPVINALDRYETEKAVVEIHAEDGAEIRYTLDGSTPVADSTLYEGPFEVSGSVVVSAVAFKPDWFESGCATHVLTRIWSLGEYANAPKLNFTTGGDAEWTRVKGVSADGYALRSGTIGNRQTSDLLVVVQGSGRVSFRCKVSSEADEDYVYDGFSFLVDDVSLTPNLIGGEIGWTNLTFEIAGTGPHTLCWRYEKDKRDAAGEDCAWLDAVSWTPSGTLTGLEAWLADRNLRADDVAANGRTAAECYALGLDPADATDDFRIVSIEMVDGEPKVEWEPKVNRWTGVELNAVLKGAETLDGEWKAVEGATAAEKAAMRFFKVVVEVQ